MRPAASRGPLRNALGSWQLWLGTAASLVATVLVFRGLDLGGLRRAFEDANYYLLPVSILAIIVAIYLRALRWRVLFYPLQDLSTGHLFGAVNVGYLINNTIPLRAGEFARAYVVGQSTGVSAVRAFSTVIVERVLDVLAIGVIVLAAGPFVDEPPWLRVVGVSVTAGALTVMVALAIGSRDGSWGRRLALRASDRLPSTWQARARDAIDSAASGMEVVRSASSLLRASLYTAGTWLATALAMSLILTSFSISGGFTAALFVAAATTMSTSIPAAPGYVGVFHVAAAKTLTEVFGTNQESAASFALVLHLLVYLTPVLIGLAYLWLNRGLLADLIATLSGRLAAVKERDGREPPRAKASLPRGDV